jgi:hypothetical protein
MQEGRQTFPGTGATHNVFEINGDRRSGLNTCLETRINTGCNPPPAGDFSHHFAAED